MSTENRRVQITDEYHSNVIQMDMTKELLEEDDTKVIENKTGLMEVIVTIEGKNFKTLIDTGSEISVVSENVVGELKEINKNIPSLPVADVTVVGVVGVRSKRVTKQVQLNIFLSLIHI